MSDYELLPCPHCGGIAETNVYGATGEWVVKCPCGAEMNRRVYTEAEAIEAWNKRRLYPVWYDINDIIHEV